MLAEYALSGIDKPIGVSSYELTRALPPKLRSVLPTVEEIEAELAEPGPESSVQPKLATSRDGVKSAKKPRTRGPKKPRKG
jgi:hypothetical protein